MNVKPLHNTRSLQWTRSVDTDEAFEGAHAIQIRNSSIAANHKETFSIMRIDVARAYFDAGTIC